MPRFSALLTARRVALLVAVVIFTVMVPVLVGGRATFRHLAGLSWTHVTLLFLVLAAGWGLNALRCQLIFRSNGIRFRTPETLGMTWLYEAATQGTPGGIGGPVAAWAMLRRRQVPTPVMASMGLFIIAFDIAALILLIIATLLAAAFLHPASAPWQLAATLWGMLLVLALIAGVVRFRRQLVRLASRLRGARGSGKWRPGGPVLHFLRLGHTVERLARLPRLHLLALLFASTGHWGCRLSIFHLTVVAVGGNVSWADTFAIQIVSSLAGMMTGLPAGYIGADMTMTVLLMPAMDIHAIATVILLWRLLTFHATLLMGALSLPWLAHHLLAPGELHLPWRR